MRGFVDGLTSERETDIAYVNLGGTFYYLIAALDGHSRYLLHWELRESMTERDVEIVLQRTREIYPDARPRIISDNGSAFIARDFKVFLREAGMTHVRTSPYYPQSNGKMERWYRTLKADAIRRFQPSTPDEARTVVERFVDHYNHVRLHSSLGYVTPADMLAGRETEIWTTRDAKLEAAREARRLKRQRLHRPVRNRNHHGVVFPLNQYRSCRLMLWSAKEGNQPSMLKGSARIAL